jgi:formylglycine-generating enzyme required for sulfatase activity
MKKFLISLVFISAFLMISCGDSDTGNTGNTGNSGDTGDTGNTGNTGDAENSDADTEDTGNTADDSDSGNTGDSGDMVSVPEGSFWMGCNEEVDDQCESDEYPYHEVTLSAFEIDKYEVTVEEYQKCIEAGDCNNGNKNEPHYEAFSSYCNIWEPEKSDYPINCVTWFGAQAYCKWVGKRLPTEAEWEKAARGPDGRKYPWGNEDATCEYAIMYDLETKTGACGKEVSWPVGSRENGKSPYGAYDMSGNIMEWVHDLYDSNYYATSPEENPTGAKTGSERVLRGGSAGRSVDGSDTGKLMRTSYRSNDFPSLWYANYGFRCAK